jgi:hypothetical protein
MNGMLDFDESLSDFLTALFTFVNDLLNGVFGCLADFFSGITISF